MEILKLSLQILVYISILDILFAGTSDAAKQKTDKFTIRIPIGYTVLAVIAIILMFVSIRRLYQAGDLTFIKVFLAVASLCPVIPFLVSPIEGFYTIKVDGDDIFATILFTKHRHLRFSELSYWTRNFRGLKLYSKDGEALFVDAITDGVDILAERLIQEGIPRQ